MAAASANPRARLEHILFHIRGVAETVSGVDFETYSRVYHMERTVERAVQIISEAVRALPPNLTARHPGKGRRHRQYPSTRIRARRSTDDVGDRDGQVTRIAARDRANAEAIGKQQAVMELATSTPVFDTYRDALLSQPLSAIWRGHGSAIFLEFGKLQPPQTRRDGSEAKSRGQYSVMIEWTWRVEAETSIVCGSWSDEKSWEGVFGSLIGRTVEDVALHGRLPELTIALSGGRYVSSFMVAEGQPAWVVFDNTDSGGPRWINVQNGAINEGG